MGVLPGGYWDASGRLHRDFELSVLTGREEELLARVGRPESATLVTEVLSRCVRRLERSVPPHPTDGSARCSRLAAHRRLGHVSSATARTSAATMMAADVAPGS